MINIVKFLIIFFPLLISIAILTLVERKVLGYTQIRKGPNIVGLYGLLQPLADGIKLFLKEPLVPNHVNIFVFILSPLLMFILSIIVWFLIPFNFSGFILNSSISLLIILSINSVSVFSVIMAGWGSNSKYGFIGSVRATSQMISYEVSLGLIIMNISIICHSLDLIKIYLYQESYLSLLMPLLPIFFLFFISLIAETNRAPFDLSESESELVSGYNIEYSGFIFALFFLGEYSHIIFSSYFICMLFTSSSVISIYLKSIVIIFIFLWIRSSFPRFRYDHLMHLLWKTYLPMSIFLFIMSGLIYIIL